MVSENLFGLFLTKRTTANNKSKYEVKIAIEATKNTEGIIPTQWDQAGIILIEVNWNIVEL